MGCRGKKFRAEPNALLEKCSHQQPLPLQAEYVAKVSLAYTSDILLVISTLADWLMVTFYLCTTFLLSTSISSSSFWHW